MKEDLCGPNLPTTVEIRFQQGSEKVSWFACDLDGNLVDSRDTTDGLFAEQTVALSSPGGISRVKILGAQICIDEICFSCEVLESCEVSNPLCNAQDGGIFLSWSSGGNCEKIEFRDGVALDVAPGNAEEWFLARRAISASVTT